MNEHHTITFDDVVSAMLLAPCTAPPNREDVEQLLIHALSMLGQAIGEDGLRHYGLGGGPYAGTQHSADFVRGLYRYNRGSER